MSDSSTRRLGAALCDALEIDSSTVQRIVLTIDVEYPFPVVELTQVVTGDVEIDGDGLVESVSSYELRRKETRP